MLIQYLIDRDIDIAFVVKKFNKYMCIQTDTLRFVDVSNFLAPGFSYSQYLKAYEVPEKKFSWIHNLFTSLSVPDRTDFLEHWEFFSKLKGENISREEYDYCHAIWKKHGMRTLEDLLRFHNCADVLGFITALENQASFFRSKIWILSRQLAYRDWLSGACFS